MKTLPPLRSCRPALLGVVLLAGFRAFAAEPILKLVSSEKTMTLTATEFAALPRTELKLVDQMDKKERQYAGVSMRELLNRMGAPLGDKMRGPALTLGVIVRCRDGYTVLFSLAEFDENFSDRTILLADQEDGQILPPSAAPFRIVTPGDKRGARSARGVAAVEIVSLAKP